jgi:hypothetical protein
MNFYNIVQKSVLGQQYPQIFTSLELEASLGTTTKNKNDKERSL